MIVKNKLYKLVYSSTGCWNFHNNLEGFEIKINTIILFLTDFSITRERFYEFKALVNGRVMKSVLNSTEYDNFSKYFEKL